MATVVLENLTKAFPEKHGAKATVVHGISLEIKAREFMVLVGPSGCGKSTVLRMIAGLEDITSGTVSISGKAVNDLPPKDRDIAMVFQNYALYPHMSVYENMAFGLKLRKYPAAEIDARVNEAARMLGLENYLHRRPRALSGGQRQRVAVGRAIVRKPKVFLFDEPLSNLDAKMRVTTRAEISRLHSRLEATMIYVTHDQVEAMTMGDRICVMRDGRIMQVDEPIAIYNNPANLFVAGFIGSPPMNLVRGTVQKDGERLVFMETGSGEKPGLAIPLDQRLAATAAAHIGKELVFGIRPEHVIETSSDDHAAVTLRIEVAEPMGAETYLHFFTASSTLVARVKPTRRYEQGEMSALKFDLAHAHFFDGETEQAL